MPFSHAISRWWIWVVGLLTGFVLLVPLGFLLAAPAGQRQAALESSGSPIPAPTLQAGWTLHRDPADGFEVAIPDSWSTVRTDPRYAEADLTAISQTHPDVAQVLRRLNQAMSGKGVKLMAADPAQPSGVYTNLMVLVYDAGFGPSLDREANEYASGVEENSGIVKPVTKQKVTLPVGQAVRVEAHSVPVGGTTITQISYVLVHGRQGKTSGFLLVLSMATDQRPATQPVVDQLMGSFRYLD